MKSALAAFLKKLVITTSILAVVMVFTFTFFIPSRYIPVLPLLLLFVVGFTFFSFSWLIKSSGNNFGKFIRKVMAVTILRLLVYILITVLYAWLLKKDLPVFVIFFAVIYLIYTSLEVYELIAGSGKIIHGNK